MKKLKLVLVALMAMMGLGAQAQSWTASEVGGGDFFLYNVGKGQFLTRGNGWGTQASVSTNSALTLTLEEYDGAYKLRTNIQGSGKGLERLGDPVIYTDQSDGKNSTWTFTKVADGSNGPIYTIVSKDNHSGGAGSYMTASADNTIVGPADAVTGDYGRWQLLQSWITNSQPVGDANGWTTSQTPTFDGGNVCAEFWNKSGATIKQTLSNLPAGSYELIAVAFTRTGMTATLNAGSNTMSIATASTSEANNRGQANTWFNNGNGVNKLTFTHAGGNLEIGLTADNTTGDHWLVWRSFVLIYKGLDLTELKDALQAQIDAVSALESTTTAAAYNAAKNYADGIDMDALTTEEAISTASSELSALVDAAKALQTNYARYNNIKAAIIAINSDINLTSADTQVEAATTNEEIDAAIATARTALKTYIAGIENEEIDLTAALLTNPGFESGDLTGWTNSGSINAQAQGNKAFDNTQDDYYAERWHVNGTVDLNQTITDMPVGYYQLSAYIYSEPSDGLLYANSTSTSVSTSKLYTVPFNLTEAGDIKFGASCTLTSSTWFCMDGFKLEFLGTAPLSLYQQQLADAVSAANAHADELAIPAGIKSTYTSAISTAAAKNSTIAECLESIDDIQAATAAADAAVAPYAAYLIAVDDATIVGVADATISAQNTAVAAATTAAGIEECTAALRTAIAAVPSFDITAETITNATPTSNANGWTCSVDPNAFDPGNNNAEFWSQPGATMKQTINLLPGTYCLTVIALQRINCVGTIEAAGKTTRIIDVPRSTANDRTQAKNYFDAGNGVNTVYFTVEGEEAQAVTIGINADATTDDHWTVWRSFTLTTYTESVAASYLIPAYEEALAAATAAKENADYANVTGNELSDLNAAIEDIPDGTVASYEEKTSALTAATATFIAAKTNYDIYAAERALADAISTEITVTAPNTAEEALTQFRALKVAEYNYVATAYPFSATSKIGDFNGWTRTGSVNGNTNVTFEALNSQHWSGAAMTYYEQPAGGWSTNPDTKWTANYEKITTLPAGSYVIKVAARAASGTGTVAKITCSAATLDGPIFNFGDTGKGITTAGVASFDEGTFCNNGNGRGWVWNYLPFTLTEETEVTMTVFAEANGARQWFSVCDGELLSMTNIADAVAYDEAVDNTIENVELANVTMTRTIKDGYNTVCLPFDLTANQVQAAFGTGAEVYAFSDEVTDDSTEPKQVQVNFTRVVAGTISANVPVLVKATAASEQQVFNGVEVKAAAEAKVEGTYFDFVGTYAPADVAEGDYFIGEGKLWKSEGSTNIKAFRAYIRQKTAAARIVSFFIDGQETTGIVNVNLNENDNENCYDLQGRRVERSMFNVQRSMLKKGLYIVNGKKVLVK